MNAMKMIILRKRSADDNKSMKNYPGYKELNTQKIKMQRTISADNIFQRFTVLKLHFISL